MMSAGRRERDPPGPGSGRAWAAAGMAPAQASSCGAGACRVPGEGGESSTPRSCSPGTRFHPTHPRLLFGAALPARASPGTRRQRSNNSLSKRHPALPWMCLAAPWLGMQEGMELQAPWFPRSGLSPRPAPVNSSRCPVPSSGHCPTSPTSPSRQIPPSPGIWERLEAAEAALL